MEEKIKEKNRDDEKTDEDGSFDKQSPKNQISLYFIKISNAQYFYLLISIPDFLEKKLIKYSKARFELLLDFGQQVKQNIDDGWIDNRGNKKFRTIELDRTLYPIIEANVLFP